MAQSISALNATLPLSSDRSSFISKPLLHSFFKSFKPKHNPNPRNAILSMATADPRGGDLDHLQRVSSVRPQQPQVKRRPDAAAAAPVGVWDRFPTARTVQQMMETMERLMEDPLAYTTTTSTYPPPSPPAQNGSYSRGRTPWEIKEGENDYKMRFDMPGMTKEDVKVWLEEKMLILQAEKTPKRKQKEGENNGSSSSTTTETVNGNGSNVAAVEVEEEEEEWPAKSFWRYKTRIALPENVQFEKIKAEVKDGVLYITVPKASVSAKVLDIAVQ